MDFKTTKCIQTIQSIHSSKKIIFLNFNSLVAYIRISGWKVNYIGIGNSWNKSVNGGSVYLIVISYKISNTFNLLIISLGMHWIDHGK